MDKSGSIAKLAKALSLAQGEIDGAVKDSANPFFKSRYADLESIISAIKAPFSKNGLSYSQFPIVGEKDHMLYIETMLMHESGEFLSTIGCIPVGKPTPQDYGSAITYLRRYMLQAIVGIPSIDDDAESVQKNFRQSAPQSKPAVSFLSIDDRKVIFSKMKENKVSEEEFKKFLAEKYKTSNTSELRKEWLQDINTFLDAKSNNNK